MKSPNDNRPDSSNSNDGQDEHDIAQLFREQKTNVPAELDDAILAYATAAHNKQNTNPAFKPVNRRFTPWFAVAATVVIGVSVAPLLLKAPESSLPASAPEPSYQSPVTFDSADSSDITATEPQALQELARSAEPAASALAEPIAQRKVQSNAVRAQNAADMLSSQAPTAEVVPPYRVSTKAWLEHIRTLLEKNNHEEVAKELLLFRKAHPDVELPSEFPEP